MATFNKVAVLGKGFLGSAIVEQLVNAGFSVTVLTRNRASLKELPTNVGFAEVDYTSVESLVAALRGHDAAVCTAGLEAIPGQNLVIDACIQAGVKRYIPSDWGAETTDPRAQEALLFLTPIVKIQKYLAEKAKAGALEYTIFATGAFLDSLLATPFAVDFTNRAVKLYDSGKHPFSTTSLASVGKAVAGALKNPEATKNRNIFIHDTTVSQSKLLALGKKYAPGEWTVTELDAETEYQKAQASVEKEGITMSNTLALMAAMLLSGKFACAYKSVDNEVVGLGYLSDEELEAKVAALFK